LILSIYSFFENILQEWVGGSKADVFYKVWLFIYNTGKSAVLTIGNIDKVKFETSIWLGSKDREGYNVEFEGTV
jgi:hypothetical protein